MIPVAYTTCLIHTNCELNAVSVFTSEDTVPSGSTAGDRILADTLVPVNDVVAITGSLLLLRKFGSSLVICKVNDNSYI